MNQITWKKSQNRLPEKRQGTQLKHLREESTIQRTQFTSKISHAIAPPKKYTKRAWKILKNPA